MTQITATFFCAAALLHSNNIIAAEWSIAPSLNIKVTQSDNFALQPNGSEISDQIQQVNPGFSISGKGSGLSVNANYQMRNFFYSKNSKAQTSNHSFNSNANAELVDQSLYLDAQAAVTQQYASPNAPLTTDNSNINSNSAHVASYSIAPYLKHNFDNIAYSEVRYILDEVYTKSGGIANRRSNTLQVNLKNSSVGKTIGWGLGYRKQNFEYTDTVNTLGYTGNESYSLSLVYFLTGKFSLSATAGQEKYDYLSIGNKPEGSTESIGISWTPTERTAIEASVGQRFFGSAFMLNVNHRTRKTSWNLGYNEDITTTQSQYLIPATIDTARFLNNLWEANIPDETQRQQAVTDFINATGLPSSLAEPINFSSNRVFVQKRLQASFGITGTRNTVLLSIYTMLREAQTSSSMDSALLGNNYFSNTDRTKQVGGNIFWNIRISPRTSAIINTNALATGRQNYVQSINLGVSRQFQPKLTGSVDFRRILQHSSQPNGSFQENAITAALSIKF